MNSLPSTDLSENSGCNPNTPKLWQTGTLTYTTGELVLLFCWLLWGDFAWSIRDRAVPATVQLLFQRFGASDTLVGVLFSSLPAAIGFIVGPVVGYKSDRLRSRWGRRIPFLIVPTPFIVLSIIGLGFSPQIGSFVHHLLGSHALALAPTVLIFMGLFWTIFEISCIAANSVFHALINDVVPQAVIGRFFGLFRACSLIAGMLLGFWIMGKAETHYIWIFLGVAAIYGFGFTLMCLKVKEGEYPLLPDLPEEDKSPLAAVQTYFKDSFTHPYYLWFFATSILCGFATGPFNIYSLFYAKSLGVEMDFYFKCTAVTYGVSLLLAYPLGALVDRFHPLRVSLIVIALYGLVMGWGIFYVKNASSFTVILMLHTLLSGTYYTTSASLGQRLLPQSKFAELSSAGGVLSSVVNMTIPPLLGLVLDYSHHAYSYVLFTAFGLAVLGLSAGFILYRQFIALGGSSHYKAPELM
jgi:MFS family permease